jgi:hypothetical protein
MIRRTGFFLAISLWTGPAVAQTVIRPDPPLDSARVVVRDALLVLRDSLNTVDAAAARLQRDFRQASGPSLLSRARVMHQVCTHSGQTVPVARRVVLDAQLSQPIRLQHRKQLVVALDELSKALARCELDFAAMSKPGEAETVRGYGNPRAIRVQSAIRKYETSLSRFLGVMGIKVTPLGGNPRAAAG